MPDEVQPTILVYATSTPSPMPMEAILEERLKELEGSANAGGQQRSTKQPTPYVIVEAASLNVRAGPSTDWPVVDGLNKGDKRPVVARNPDNTWVAIQDQKDDAWVWVSAKYVELSVSMTALPIIRYYDCQHWYFERPDYEDKDCPVKSISEAPIPLTPTLDLEKWKQNWEQNYPTLDVIKQKCDGLCSGIEDEFKKAHCYDRCIDDLRRWNPYYP